MEDFWTQVEGLKVMHRAGQTFITFRETGNPVLNGRVTWGGLKRRLDAQELQKRLRYRIYRHASLRTAWFM